VTSTPPAILSVAIAPTYTNYARAVAAAGAIHYYPMNETNGPTAIDLGTLAGSTNFVDAADGLVTNGVGTYEADTNGGILFGQPSAGSFLGTAVHFDGVSGTFLDLTPFYPGPSMTLELWVNLDLTASHSPDYNSISGRFRGMYDFSVIPTGIPEWTVATTNVPGYRAVDGPSAMSRGEWHYLVAEYDSADGYAQVFMDGVGGTPVYIGGGLQDAGPSPDHITIGSSYGGTGNAFNWQGLINNVAFYNYALSPSQIQSHFNVSPVAPLLIIQPSATITWPAFPSGYVLQSAASVTGPYANYTGNVFLTNDTYFAPVPTTGSHQYYRLIQAP
jgi:hypothetical protein